MAQEKIKDKFYIKSDYRHLAVVMRAKVGMRFTISVLGDLTDYLCEVQSVTGDCVVMNILQENLNERESGASITLFAGCLKGDAAEKLVQQAVELGVREIVFFRSHYTVSDVDEKKAERFKRIAAEACKQCCRNALVDISPALTFSAMINKLKGFERAYFCCEEGGTPLANVIDTSFKNIAVIVGSEGGFSPDEMQALKECCISVSLGKRILRAHTASLYALAVIDALYLAK